MDGNAPVTSRSAEEVFGDYKGRRAALIKALTTDADEFYRQCNPERENLCLYGHPNQQWEVNLPAEEVPPELPEPVLGINFARDGMLVKDWISLVAIHSDTWLLALAYYFAARFGFQKSDRKRLFNLINDLPTVFEVVNETAKKQSKEKSSVVSKSSNNKSKPGSVRVKHTKEVPQLADENDDEVPIDDEEEEDDDDDDDEDGYLCRACGKNDSSDDFWIYCDVCEKWFHGSCVKITPAKAETIKRYKCPSCSSNNSNNKRARV